MKLIPHYPLQDIYPIGLEYVHTTEVVAASRLLIVSGTMGLDPVGKAAKTIDEQLRLIWRNISVIPRDADVSEEKIVQISSYLSDPAFSNVNAMYRMDTMKRRAVAMTTLVTGLLEANWLVEIEVLAAGD